MTSPRSLSAALAALGGVALCGAILAGCSSGTGTVAKADVESQAATQLAKQVNQPTPTVTCPGDLTAKVGATLDCTLVAQGDTTKYPVHIVVTSVKGSTVDFSSTVGAPAG